jgi:endonuclease/exonuclease/phosphatase family metal-dependent hydrolase
MNKLLIILFVTFIQSHLLMANELKIMSWNIYFDDTNDSQRYSSILATIRNQKADIVCLQEVTDKFITLISNSNVLDDYAFINLNGKGAYKNIILSTLNNIQSGTISLPTNMNRYAPFVVTEFNSHNIKIVNLHLDSLLSDTTLRIKQLEKINKVTKADKQLIICGDFNFGDNDVENKYIVKHFNDAGKGIKTYTYDVNKNSRAKKTKFKLEGNRRLDRILTKGAFNTKHYQVIEDNSSDHYPVIAEFKIKH